VTEPIFTNWRKSPRSSGGGNCVEVAHTSDGALIGVRDTKNRARGTLVFSRDEWLAFIASAKDGEFDLP
jgi:hypothetical protein